MNHRKRAGRRPTGNVHGVLVVDKPMGPTSHDIVAQVRRIFGTRRVGHAGTLDPMATGVLVVLLGEATKLSSVLTTERKVYEAEIAFGMATDSLDSQGKTTKKRDLGDDWLTQEALSHALDRERSRTLQLPPQVSAIKVAGKRAYALARQGQEADLAPRQVAIHELLILAQKPRSLQVRLDVSKGFYVRSFARDLGDALGVPSHLCALRRTSSGPFEIAQACGWPPPATTELVSIEDAAAMSLHRLDVSAEGALRIRQGKTLSLEHLTTAPAENPRNDRGGLWAAFFEHRLLALVEQRQTSLFCVRRGIHTQPDVEQALHDPSLES